MNILVIAHYQGDGSPSASFVHDQVKAYHALGHNVRVISPIAIGKCGFQSDSRFGTQCRVIDGIRYLHMRFLSLSNLGSRGFNTRSAIFALSKVLPTILDGFTPDVIHAHTLGFDSEISAWLNRRLGCPSVVTTHGSDTATPYAQGRKYFLKHCCDGADTVVGVSSKLTTQLADCGVTVPLHSILNGFAIEHLSTAEKTLGSWIQVGNLIPLKHVDTTIRAFAAYQKINPDVRLTIVGQGGERQNLENLCSELAVSHAVRFTGVLPNRQVLEEMSKTQFFVMPSHPEGFGIVYLEAMANGCITIGTEGEGISDLIISGENGFLVPPNDPDAIVRVIEWCFKHPEEASAIAERGRQTALSLTWEINAEEHIKLFQSMIERK